MDEQRKAEAAIRDHTGYAMIAALIPVPIAGGLAVTAVQLELVKQLAGLHGSTYDEARAKPLVNALAGDTLAPFAGSAVELTPEFEVALRASPQLLLSGASTYAIGRVCEEHLESGRALDTLDPASARKRYRDSLERGKDVASSIRQRLLGERECPAPIGRIGEVLAELIRLRDTGSLSDAEFVELKARLLGSGKEL